MSELEEELGIVYDDDENDTLNGYLVSKLDRIPDQDEGTLIEVGKIRYRILSVKDKTIDTVRVEITDTDENNE